MLFDDTPRGLLEMLILAGGFAAALSISPVLFVVLAGIGYAVKAEDKMCRRNIRSSFSYLKRKGYVEVRSSKSGKRVTVTVRGFKCASMYRIRKALAAPMYYSLKWDKKWRLILFDIPTEDRAKRNAFRFFIKHIGAIMLQKSVWVYPFDCSERIILLRQFFQLTEKELRLVVVDSLDNDQWLRKHFKC
ncbi:CRISPR-associated endonuclease Cas2 [Candidatus Kaiserbacteria bacterium RIFCSPLOWO2_01_FULL_50_24]|uniref:CRISPR-associated endonuclease Cas2 n=1 Tax=Candidatus Kaiserbacteria bacterium RIFCSPLOWO2_01_FULL_50_24 TaxID=1798507 RepID=A0A1F6EMK7_9BACT|nr:MAG: CRISPR-associated endonuclease Cas2 [Candidatus Kaiserbacteria bacterium RIFCSPLOWO2_01_FULL_50_24]